MQAQAALDDHTKRISSRSEDEEADEEEEEVEVRKEPEDGKLINKSLAHKSLRRTSNQPYFSNKNLQKELILLKEQNKLLVASNEAMREKAIEALMEKEQVIQTLQQKIEETESFYKEQLIGLSSELQSVYQQRDEQVQALARLEREADLRWEDRLGELSKTIGRLQVELDAREREIEEITNSMEVLINERVHEKMKANYDLERKRKEDMLLDTLTKIDDRDAVIKKAELRISELSNKLGILEKKCQKDSEEFMKKMSSSKTEHDEEIIKLKKQQARQLEKQEMNWIEQLSGKSSQISELEKSRQVLLSKIANLQEENREIRELNACLQEEVKQNESYKRAYHEKLREIAVNYEEQIAEMDRKLSQERYFWNLRDVDAKLKSPFRTSERVSELADTRKTLESEIGALLKNYEQQTIQALGEGEKYILKINRESFAEEKALERTLKKKGASSKHEKLLGEKTVSKEQSDCSGNEGGRLSKLQQEYEHLCRQIETKQQELNELNSEIISHKRKADKRPSVNGHFEDKYTIPIWDTEEKIKPTGNDRRAAPRFSPFGGLGLFFKNRFTFSDSLKKF